MKKQLLSLGKEVCVVFLTGSASGSQSLWDAEDRCSSTITNFPTPFTEQLTVLQTCFVDAWNYVPFALLFCCCISVFILVPWWFYFITFVVYFRIRECNLLYSKLAFVSIHILGVLFSFYEEYPWCLTEITLNL